MTEQKPPNLGTEILRQFEELSRETMEVMPGDPVQKAAALLPGVFADLTLEEARRAFAKYAGHREWSEAQKPAPGENIQ